MKNINLVVSRNLLITLILAIAIILSLTSVSALSTTATVNWDSEVGEIRGDFYGANVGTGVLASDMNTYGAWNGSLWLNATEYQNAWLLSNMKTVVGDMRLHAYYYNSTNSNGVNFTDGTTNGTNFTIHIETIKWAYLNNLKIVYIADYMPTWLADNSTGQCNDLNMCPPNNQTKWNNIVLDFINRSTQGNETLKSIISIQVWNEPDVGTYWMGKLGNGNNSAAHNFSIFYNSTYWAIKTIYPTMKIGIGGFARPVSWTNFVINATTGNTYDFVGFHDYRTTDFNPTIYDSFSASHGLMRTLFPNTDLYITEWNTNNAAIQNDTYTNRYSMQISSGYTYILNTDPDNTILQLFKFWNSQKVTSGLLNRWEMFSGTQLANSYYPSFNQTKLYANNHKAGNTVVTSSTSAVSVKIVASKDEVTGQKYLTITNTNTSAFNVTLRTNVAMRNVETNTIYPVNSSGDIYIPNMASYGVSTLTNVNTTVISLMSTQIGVVKNDFYGVQDGSSHILKKGVLVDTNGDGTYDTLSNYSWYRQKFLESGMKMYRYDMSLWTYYTCGLDTIYNQFRINGTSGCNNTGNLENMTELQTWLSQNDIELMWIADYMPQGLADNSSGMCTNLGQCPAVNYSTWKLLVIDFLNKTSSNGIYNASLVEIWNEPDYASAWLGGLNADNINRYNNYSILYNSTYDAVKSWNNNILVGGPASTYPLYYPNFTRNFLGNYSNKMDFFSFHGYNGGDLSTMLDANLKMVLGNCTTYGANCRRIIVSEYNFNSATNLNGTNGTYANLRYSENFIDRLNTYPNNLTLLIHQYGSRYKYGASYTMPYYMVSEPQMDNYISKAYNITKLFTRYAPAQGTIYNTTITDEGSVVKAVSSKISGKQNLIITNTENGVRNITLSCGTFNGNLIDVSSKELYSCASGSTNLGTLEPFEVRVLTEPVVTQTGGYLVYDNYLGEEISRVQNGVLTRQDGKDRIAIQFLIGISMFGIIFIVIGAGAVYIVFNGGSLEEIDLPTIFITLATIILITIITIYIVGQM